MTVLTWIAIIYYSIRVHTRRFGSYRHLLVICALLNLSTQIISIAAIVLAILTDKNNIFSAPEFAFGGDGKTWLHAGSHIFIGIPVGSLVGWLDRVSHPGSDQKGGAFLSATSSSFTQRLSGALTKEMIMYLNLTERQGYNSRYVLGRSFRDGSGSLRSQDV